MIADLSMQHALDRYHQAGVAGLTEQEKTLATIWCFESKVANGGFEHWFRSAEGELAAYAPTAFRNVGAEALARIAERANAVFGRSGLPAGHEARTSRLAELGDEGRRVFDQLERDYAESGADLDEKVEAYAVAHPLRPA